MARYSVRLVLKLGHLIVEFGTPDSGYMERVFKGKVPYNRKIISEFFGFMEFSPKNTFHVSGIGCISYVLSEIGTMNLKMSMSHLERVCCLLTHSSKHIVLL